MNFDSVKLLLAEVSKILKPDTSPNLGDPESQKEGEYDEEEIEEDPIVATKEKLDQTFRDLTEIKDGYLEKKQEMVGNALTELNRTYRHLMLMAPFPRLPQSTLSTYFLPTQNGTLIDVKFICKTAVNVSSGEKTIKFNLRESIDKIINTEQNSIELSDMFGGKVWPMRFKFNDVVTNYNKSIKVKVGFEESEPTILCMPVEVSVATKKKKPTAETIIEIGKQDIAPVVKEKHESSEDFDMFAMKPNIPDNDSFGKKGCKFNRTGMWATYVLPFEGDELDQVVRVSGTEDVTTIENNLTSTTILQTLSTSHPDAPVRRVMQDILDSTNGEVYKMTRKRWTEIKKEIASSYKVYSWDDIQIEIEPYDGVFKFRETKNLHFSMEVDFSYKLLLN